MYHPSANPNDSISFSGPHESSNFNESSPHEFIPEPSNNTVETRSPEFHVPPQAVESSITVENVSSQPPLAYELSNTVKSRSSELSEPPPAYESSNTAEKTSQDFPQPPPENIVESRSQGIIEPPLVYEPRNSVEFSEPPQEDVESSNVVESGSQELNKNIQLADIPREHSKPPQVHGLTSYEIRPHELPEPSPAFNSSGIQEIRSEEFFGKAEPVGIQLPKSTAQPSQREDLSGPSPAYESNIVVESEPQELSERRQANGWASGPDIVSVLSPVSKLLEGRPREYSELPQVHGLSSYESKQPELPVLPSPVYRSIGTQEIRSDEFSGPPPASGSSNAAEIRSQEFSAPPANGSSNAVESSSHISLVQRIIETVHLIASMEDFQTHKRECSTVIRRVNMLVPLFVEFRDSGLPFSEAVFTCFSSFEAALNTAKALILLCSEGSKLYMVRFRLLFAVLYHENG